MKYEPLFKLLIFILKVIAAPGVTPHLFPPIRDERLSQLSSSQIENPSPYFKSWPAGLVPKLGDAKHSWFVALIETAAKIWELKLLTPDTSFGQDILWHQQWVGM